MFLLIGRPLRSVVRHLLEPSLRLVVLVGVELNFTVEVCSIPPNSTTKRSKPRLFRLPASQRALVFL